MPLPRTVVITGAAGGIGRALLAAFAAPGTRLIALDLPGTDLAGALAPHGGGHVALTCDQSDEQQILDAWSRIDALGGGIDVLVNNAAIGPTMAPTLATEIAHFRRTLHTNVDGPFVMAREAASRMRPGGAITNIASLAGVLSNPRRNAYAASKAALISVTRSLACEWADRGIRVNAVAPGYVRTPMVAALEAEGKADLAAVRRRIPLGRLARPDEIAAVAEFLSSGAAPFVTGAVLVADGGWASFNQPGDAHPPAETVPGPELAPPPGDRTPRVVVVTGGADGIGAATVRRFTAAGDRVAILDRDAAAATVLADQLGARAYACDVSDETAVTAAFAAIARDLGPVEVLVNNAAVADAFQPATVQGFADLDRTLDVNLTGAFLCAQAALRTMVPGGGVIVNLGSIAGLVPMAPRHAYGASKAGLDMLTRCMAAELGPLGLRCVTVAPGYIRTPGVAALERSGRIDTDTICARIPMGRLGLPEDIAEAVWFVASPGASYVTGGLLSVDGGWSAFGSAGPASGG
jgi:NAD(P)-dependent dehydrogenase (short-subunit alcohol dehydrogenase family)